MSDRNFKILGWFLTAMVLGLIVFGLAAWRAVSVETAEAFAAGQAFASIREKFPGRPPMLIRDESGRFVPNPMRADDSEQGVRILHVLAYRVHERRLVRADVPFWFFKLKGPAAQLALRETGFDLKRLAVTPADLRRQGPGVILDQTTPGGDGLMVWAE